MCVVRAGIWRHSVCCVTREHGSLVPMGGVYFRFFIYCCSRVVSLRCAKIRREAKQLAWTVALCVRKALSSPLLECPPIRQWS